MPVNRARRQASDAVLYVPQTPGDDNYNNPITNVDFHVTPPVRSLSVSELMDPHDIRNAGYFRAEVAGNYLPSTSAILEQEAYESPTNDFDALNTEHVSTPTGRAPTTDPTALGLHPENTDLKDGDRDVKQTSLDKDRDTNTDSHHHATIHREKSFGTNLTTGKREYLSQYEQRNTHSDSSTRPQEVSQSPTSAVSDDAVSELTRKSDADSMRETDTSTDYARDSDTSTDGDIY